MRMPIEILLLLLLSLGMPARSHSGFVTFDVPGATYTVAYGVNDLGQIVGSYANGFGQFGFLYSQGAFQTLDVPGSSFTVAQGINDQGEIVGWSSDGAFSYQNGQYTLAQYPKAASYSINNSGQIVGIYQNPAQHGLVDSGGFFYTLDPPNSAGTLVAGENNVGEIVGAYSQCAGCDSVGFTYFAGVFSNVVYPGSVGTQLWGVNDSGEIVGNTDISGASYAFVLDNGDFTTLPVGVGIDTGASDINEAGEIVGYWVDQAGTFHGYYGSTTPEPATWLLTVLGPAVFAAWSWRSRRNPRDLTLTGSR